MTTVAVRALDAPLNRWKQYSSFRESGADWIGLIPAHWEAGRIRYVARLESGHTPSRQHPEYWSDCTIPSFTLADVWQLRDGSKKYVSETAEKISDLGMANSAARLLPANTVILSRTASVGFTGILDRPMATSQDFVNWICGSRILPEYLWYVFRGMRQEFERLMMGSTHQTIYMPQVQSFATPIPTAPEQRAIIRFLDRETAKIDALIAKKQRLIKLLKEKRTALIGHAVTRGLDPHVLLKESGIEWLGRIPAHWEAKRLKHVYLLETGHTPSKSDATYWLPEECNIPWISLNDTKSLESADVIDDMKIKISITGMRNSAAHLIEPGAVVFNRDGARVGLSSITTKPMCLSQHLIGWVCGPTVFNYYLLHVLYAMEQEIYQLTAGATIPTIGMTDVKRMVIPVPPLEEQYGISDYLVNQRAGITGLIQRIGNQTVLLREYRTALISAAVTGKIDVREEVA